MLILYVRKSWCYIGERLKLFSLWSKHLADEACRRTSKIKLCTLKHKEGLPCRRALLVMEESSSKLWYHWSNKESYLFRDSGTCHIYTLKPTTCTCVKMALRVWHTPLVCFVQVSLSLKPWCVLWVTLWLCHHSTKWFIQVSHSTERFS